MSLLHPHARLIDAATGTTIAGAELAAQVSAAADAYEAEKAGVVFLRIPGTVSAVVRYLGAWPAQRPIALVDPVMSDSAFTALVARYRPAVVIGLDESSNPPDGYVAQTGGVLGPRWRRSAPAPLPHPDLGVLLATSGSTGSPKFVRLSRRAVLTNTASIIEALGIGEADVTISTLPFFYSFGMSVLNTHLAAGATIVLESGGLLDRPFWTAVNDHAVTSLSCVPYQFEMLRRLRFDPAKYPSIRTLSQAGGRLKTEAVQDFQRRIEAVGGRLYVMYGQTEAAPRLTTLPAERLADKIGSVGPAVPGGTLSIRLDDGTETTAPGVEGQVIYRGPNVMMGYALDADDLVRGDDLAGVLATGDLGHLDDEGFLYLGARLNRFGKVFGVRLSLDDIESLLAAHGPVAAVSGEEKIVVWLEQADRASLGQRAAELAASLKLHYSGFDVRSIDALPLLPNGKVDYQALEKAA
jgi:acyl-CoA synthetase (AMP-forming)/AMP-acid ligase II